ncbi:hypothetical protein SDRG_12927 [Saprolegnia diclina VS20]|uniref:Secreted protein n=1 Tax=Saprolegnia diclina (strain VS20) TaxID=1156394 RepID=T0PUQ8_SAPDV|nr:hypothetical protein SDRG_12927 [Saprolegnia diclina VS20]EQC29259.1 hypothetical protein SDRG_12927 [Saprolegnia diclina VS20]|eukprot:XP_008617233.1 hypothetical protein SDRG_12927 [Saprolegnia diclina VS20]
MKAAIILAAAASSAFAVECSLDQFMPLVPIATDPNGPFAKCAADIQKPVTNLMKPSWIPEDLATVKLFGASDNCKNFFATVTKHMATIAPPCTLTQKTGPTTSDVAAKLSFDQAIKGWTAFYSPTDKPTDAPKPTDPTKPTDAPKPTDPTKPTDAPKPTTAGPAPGPNPVPAGCTDVSVVGDATYCIAGPICSGSGLLPAGTKCPKKGDLASKDCHKHLKSYTEGGKCIAPADTVCEKIPSGAYGCVVSKGTAAPTPAASTPLPTPAASTPVASTLKPTPAPTKPSLRF